MICTFRFFDLTYYFRNTNVGGGGKFLQKILNFDELIVISIKKGTDRGSETVRFPNSCTNYTTL